MLGFLALGVVSVFLLGQHLLDTEAGLLAALLLATAPFVVFSLTNFQLDVPLTGVVALCLYLLARTEGFSSTTRSVALGLGLGVGMLTKPPFAAYVLPPLLWIAWRVSREHGDGERLARLGRLAIALAIAGMVALPWYGPRLIGLPLQIMNRSFKQAALSGKPATLSAEGLLYYPMTFPVQFGLLAVLLFVWGPGRSGGSAPPAASSGWPRWSRLSLFCLIQNKNLRYTLPILPAAALVAAAGLVLGARWRRWVTLGLRDVGALQVSMAAFALPAPPDPAHVRSPDGVHAARAGPTGSSDASSPTRAASAGARPATVAVVPNHDFFSVSNFRYEAARRRLPLEMTRGWSGAAARRGLRRPQDRPRRGPPLDGQGERLTRAVEGGDPYLGRGLPGRRRVPAARTGAAAVLRARRIAPLAAGRPRASRHGCPRRRRRSRDIRARPERTAGARSTTGRRRSAGRGRRRGSRGRPPRWASSSGEGSRTAPRSRHPPRRWKDCVFNPERLWRRGALEVLDDGRAPHRARDGHPGRPRRVPARPARGSGVARGARRRGRQRAGHSASARDRRACGSRRATASARSHWPSSACGSARLPVPDFLADWIVSQFDPTARASTAAGPGRPLPAIRDPGRTDRDRRSAVTARAPVSRGPASGAERERPTRPASPCRRPDGRAGGASAPGSPPTRDRTRSGPC